MLKIVYSNTEFEIRREGRRIIIEPVDILRQGWFKGYQAEKDADLWAGITETLAESGEWQW